MSEATAAENAVHRRMRKSRPERSPDEAVSKEKEKRGGFGEKIKAWEQRRAEAKERRKTPDPDKAQRRIEREKRRRGRRTQEAPVTSAEA